MASLQFLDVLDMGTKILTTAFINTYQPQDPTSTLLTESLLPNHQTLKVLLLPVLWMEILMATITVEV